MAMYLPASIFKIRSIGHAKANIDSHLDRFEGGGDSISLGEIFWAQKEDIDFFQFDVSSPLANEKKVLITRRRDLFIRGISGLESFQFFGEPPLESMRGHYEISRASQISGCRGLYYECAFQEL